MSQMEKREFELLRGLSVSRAVSAADNVLLTACRGNTEVLMVLTAEVAAAFAEKVRMMAQIEVWKKETLCEAPPEVPNKGH